MTPASPSPTGSHTHIVRRYVNALAEMGVPDPYIKEAMDCADPSCPVPENARLRAALEVWESEMVSIAAEWRNDWSDFDGRILRDQVNEVKRKASLALTPERAREGGSHG